MKKSKTISFFHFENWKSLPKDEINLVEKALEACEKAYAPYSKFNVGAALISDTGRIVQGNNQENIAYPSGLCAERVALFSAKANFPDEVILKIAIVSKGEIISKDDILSPCGSCRQVMAEVQMGQKPDLKIILVNPDESAICFEKIDDLLPFAFGK